MRVDFMIIGAQKCGTTSLAEQLSTHPEIVFCRIKEPGFFNSAANWREELTRYHALYATKPDGAAGKTRYGEASTMYTFYPEWRETHRRLFEYNPDLKLIYMMRDPVERIISNYSHDVIRNLVKGQPEDIIFQDPNYINRSRYGVQLRPYLERFPRQNILPLIFEEYIADQRKTLTGIAQFLAIDPGRFRGPATIHAHKSVGEYKLKLPILRQFVGSQWFQRIRAYIPSQIRTPIRRSLSNKLDEKPNFSPQLKHELRRLLEDDIGWVETLIGREIECWHNGYRETALQTAPIIQMGSQRFRREIIRDGK